MAIGGVFDSADSSMRHLCIPVTVDTSQAYLLLRIGFFRQLLQNQRLDCYGYWLIVYVPDDFCMTRGLVILLIGVLERTITQRYQSLRVDVTIVYYKSKREGSDVGIGRFLARFV